MRQVLELVAADQTDFGVTVSVTPTEVWSPVFKALLPGSGKTERVLKSVLEGSDLQGNARAPMLPVNPCAKLVQTSIRCYS